MRLQIAFSLSILLIAILLPGTSYAQWTYNGVTVSQELGGQSQPVVVSDGEGGAIIAWIDERNGDVDVYAQRIDSLGNALWTEGGVVISAAYDAQVQIEAASDGAGGAIIVWVDFRVGAEDIFAQRVDANGNTLWVSNGVAICTAADDQSSPEIISDGAGGAIIAWVDERSTSESDIYAQRVNPTGNVLWTINGVVICAANNNQSNLRVITDGAGGAILVWQDSRNIDTDIYAQRVNENGNPLWGPNGTAVCTEIGSQYGCEITTDDTGGAIIVWQDDRGATAPDIYAQRVDQGGIAWWTTDGKAICLDGSSQTSPKLVPDGDHGAIIAWDDSRNGNVDIYARRVIGIGVTFWGDSGVPVCSDLQSQWDMRMIADGEGGALFAWVSYSGPVYDVYAQRVDGTGVRQWTADGRAVCTADLEQYGPELVTDGAGGAIITWYDERGGVDWDIFAQKMDANGDWGIPYPSIHSALDVPDDEGGFINLAWVASQHDPCGFITEYTIWRALGTEAALELLGEGAKLLDSPEMVGALPDESSAYTLIALEPIIRMELVGGATYYWELIDTHPAYYLDSYSKIVATSFDSVGTTPNLHYYQVIAHGIEPDEFWISDPDSGYSVDNLSPCPPEAVAAEQMYVPEGLEITWEPNTEPDLGTYVIHRGSSSDFTPDSGNLVYSGCEVTFFDSDWRWDNQYWYKVAAVDVHGNVSDYVLLGPGEVTGDETPETPIASYLSQNYPNPFNPVTMIRFGIEARGDVHLRIYDPAGRLMRTLVDEPREAGHYTEEWDGRDNAGRAVASGVYFYKLEAGRFEETKKMVLLR